MGTTCEIARQQPNGLWKRIHISYDGYVSGVGLVLARDYDTPEKVDALFSHATGATQLTSDPAEMRWSDWYDGETTLDALIVETGCDHPGRPPEEERGIGGLGLYVHAHVRWAAPRTTASLRRFVETGEGDDVLTREALIAEGVDEARFEAEAPRTRPADLHRGILGVKEVEDGYELTLTERHDLPPMDHEPHPDPEVQRLLELMEGEDEEDDGATVWALPPAAGFKGFLGAKVESHEDMMALDGREVEVQAGSIMVSSSFGAGASSSSNVMSAVRITVLETSTDEEKAAA